MQRLFAFFLLNFIIVNMGAQDAPEMKWLNSEYVKQTNVKGPDIRKDAQGNIYSINTQVHLNPLVGFILVKYDPDGNKLWERNYPGLLPHLYFGPAIDPEGNAYVSINYGGLPGLPTYTILLKYAPDGTLLWEISFGGWANNVTNLLAAGTDGHLYFSGGVSNANITQGYFVGCLDTTDGSILWKTEMASPLNPYNMKLLEDKIVLFANGLADSATNIRYHVVQQFNYDGELLATNKTEDTSVYGPDFNSMTDEGDVLIGNRGEGYEATKLSLDGIIHWHYEKPLIYDRAFVRGLAFDDSLNTYITGGWSQQVTWLDFVTTKISSSGDKVWENIYYTSPDSLSDVGNNIEVDNLFVYVIGTENLSVNNIGDLSILILDKYNGELLYNIKVHLENLSTNGSDIILFEHGFAFIGLSDSTAISATSMLTGFFQFSVNLTENHTEKADPFLLYPNPASEAIYVQQSKRSSGKNVAEVLDLNGRLLMSSPFEGNEKIRLDTSYLPAGVYVIKVGNQASKFSIVR